MDNGGNMLLTIHLPLFRLISALALRCCDVKDASGGAIFL